MSRIDFPNLHGTKLPPQKDRFTLQFRGWLRIEATGSYGFQVRSDDGALLFIDGKLVIDANHPKAYYPVDGGAELTRGLHPIELRYFQEQGAAGLRLSCLPPGAAAWLPIPSELLHLHRR